VNLTLLFWLDASLIFLAWLLCVLAFYRQHHGIHHYGERLLFLGLTLQLLYIVAAHVELGLNPFDSLAGLFLFGSLLVLLVYFTLDFYFSNRIFEVIFPPLTLFCMMLSLLLAGQDIATSGFLLGAPVFGKLILVVHAGLTMLGYLLFGVACLTSIYFLREESLIKQHSIHLMRNKGPSLGFLDRLNHGVIATGFLAITIGLLVGIAMKIITHEGANALSWRQGLPFAAWAVYAGFLLDRSLQGLSLKSSALWAICGFFVVAASFAYEINYLLTHLPQP